MQAMLPQYAFECLLGRGGMGAVYKAVQITLDRPVAIKVLPTELLDNSDANFTERFKNEARTMARLSHASIVNVYDFGETQSGLLYFVMEFIDGTDVLRMIASQGRLPEEYALSITAHVCDALAYAHKHGVVHRDIKPANILINMEGAVKVADFGLAKANDPSQSGLTKTNMAMGTPDFVAPEAFVPGVVLDGRADLYAIGVMLYQMLTGEIPRGIWTLPGAKCGTDVRFDAIISKAMQTDREVRYQSATDIRRDLDTILTLPRAVLIAKQQAAAEAKAQATRAQKLQEEAHQEPAPKKKSSVLGPILGVAASVVLLVGLYVLFTRGGERKKRTRAVAVKSAAENPTADPSSALLPSPKDMKDKPSSSAMAAPTPAESKNPPPGTLPGDGAFSDWIGRRGEPLQAHWSVQGTEISTDQRAQLWSVTDHADFDLELEWKATPRWSGGLYYHVEGEGMGRPRFLNMHLVAPPNRGGAPCGAIDGIALPAGHVQVRVNEWNTARLLVRGSKREHWINGQKVLEYDVSSPGFMERARRTRLPEPLDISRTRGRLVLEANGGRVAFRNVRVHDLEPVAASAPPPAVMATPPAQPPAPTPAPAPVVSSAGAAATPTHPALSPTMIERGISFQGHRYRLIKGDLTWPQANARAKELGAHLVSITSRAEQEFIQQSYANVLLPTDARGVFIGARLENKSARWMWTTGEPVEYTAWMGGQPDRMGRIAIPDAAPSITLLHDRGWDDEGETASGIGALMEWDSDVRSDARVAALDKGFHERLEHDSALPYRTALAKLNQGYLTVGIAKARAAAQAKGSLADVRAFDSEKALIENGGSVPDTDDAAVPAALKALRTTYRTAHSRLIAERDAKAAPLYDIYVKALDAHISTLTKAGKTSAAGVIQDFRDELDRQRLDVRGTVAATKPAEAKSADTTPGTTSPAPSKTVSGGSSWRSAAEYLVKNGGSFTANKNGAEFKVTDPSGIPSGRFDIIEIALDHYNSVRPAPTDAGMAALQGLRDLQRAWFRFTGPSDAAFSFLAGNEDLTFINFEGVTTLTDEVLVHLKGLKNLDYLAIQYADRFTGKGLDSLAGTASIADLELLNSGITDEGMRAIGTFKKLRTLRVTSPAVTDAGAAALARVNTLAFLTLERTSIGDDSAGVIADLSNLTELHLSRTKITDAGLAKFKTLKKLKVLSLRGTSITAEAAAEFQKNMPQCRVEY